MTTPKTVLITGASSGIGHATATVLAAQGHRLLVGARRQARLEELVRTVRAEGGTIASAVLDVTDRADVEAFVARGVETYGGVDVMVNNAGVMPLSRLDALEVHHWDQMIDVNVRGLLHGIAAALPVMQRQGSGHLITMASIGAHQVSPTAAVYCATKHAAWAITEGLRQEVGDGIRVTTVSPGVVESELADTITDPGTAAVMREYRSLALPAEAIARAVAYAIDQSEGVDVSEVIVRPTGSA